MKPMKIVSLFVLVLTASTFTMCSEKDQKTVANGILPTDVVPRIVQDTWRITKYQYKETELTTEFSAYSFLYDSDGTVTATAATEKQGTWSAATDSGKTLLKMNLIEPDVVTLLDSISKDWVVTSVADDKIEMKLTNEDLTSNLLTLEKN